MTGRTLAQQVRGDHFLLPSPKEESFTAAPCDFLPPQLSLQLLALPKIYRVSSHSSWISYSSWEKEQQYRIQSSEEKKAAAFAPANGCPPGTLLYYQSPQKKAATERATANGCPPGTFLMYASSQAAKAAAAPDSIE
jgi:hypothetical protein